MLTASTYDAAFSQEASRHYPTIHKFEREMGAMLDTSKLLDAARVLACPVKARAPNWQHGRVIYAMARRALTQAIYDQSTPVTLLDIGTAKGFSALCLLWALQDSGIHGRVVSVDVIDPFARVSRNTVSEVDGYGYLTLAETLKPWPESRAIDFVKSTGRDWLTAHRERVHVAVVDGKHTEESVSWESALLAQRQQTGDVIFFDDLQIPGVKQAVIRLTGYEVQYLQACPERQYAIARRR